MLYIICDLHPQSVRKLKSPPPKIVDFESSATSLIQFIERPSFCVFKIWPASIGRRQIIVDFMKFSLSCSCPKSCTFHKHFLGPKISTEALLLTKLKFYLKKTLYLDGLPMLKTKNTIFIKSLGHPGVQSCIL
jgi:hypothetical protein